MAIETRAQKITRTLILGLLVDNVDKEGGGSVFKYSFTAGHILLEGVGYRL